MDSSDSVNSDGIYFAVPRRILEDEDWNYSENRFPEITNHRDHISGSIGDQPRLIDHFGSGVDEYLLRCSLDKFENDTVANFRKDVITQLMSATLETTVSKNDVSSDEDATRSGPFLAESMKCVKQTRHRSVLRSEFSYPNHDLSPKKPQESARRCSEIWEDITAPQSYPKSYFDKNQWESDLPGYVSLSPLNEFQMKEKVDSTEDQISEEVLPSEKSTVAGGNNDSTNTHFIKHLSSIELIKHEISILQEREAEIKQRRLTENFAPLNSLQDETTRHKMISQNCGDTRSLVCSVSPVWESNLDSVESFDERFNRGTTETERQSNGVTFSFEDDLRFRKDNDADAVKVEQSINIDYKREEEGFQVKGGDFSCNQIVFLNSMINELSSFTVKVTPENNSGEIEAGNPLSELSQPEGETEEKLSKHEGVSDETSGHTEEHEKHMRTDMERNLLTSNTSIAEQQVVASCQTPTVSDEAKRENEPGSRALHFFDSGTSERSGLLEKDSTDPQKPKCLPRTLKISGLRSSQIHENYKFFREKCPKFSIANVIPESPEDEVDLASCYQSTIGVPIPSPRNLKQNEELTSDVLIIVSDEDSNETVKTVVSIKKPETRTSKVEPLIREIESFGSSESRSLSEVTSLESSKGTDPEMTSSSAETITKVPFCVPRMTSPNLELISFAEAPQIFNVSPSTAECLTLDETSPTSKIIPLADVTSSEFRITSPALETMSLGSQKASPTLKPTLSPTLRETPTSPFTRLAARLEPIISDPDPVDWAKFLSSDLPPETTPAAKPLEFPDPSPVESSSSLWLSCSEDERQANLLNYDIFRTDFSDADPDLNTHWPFTNAYPRNLSVFHSECYALHL